MTEESTARRREVVEIIIWGKRVGVRKSCAGMVYRCWIRDEGGGDVGDEILSCDGMLVYAG